MTRLQIDVARASLDRTIAALQAVQPAIGRRALRAGVFRAGGEVLKQSRAAAPRGRTGQFKRSMAKKDIRYAAKGVYVSIIGQKRESSRRSTARQIASANRKTGAISKGLSGQGQSPSINWIESGTKPHDIPKNPGKRLWWNIVAGGTRLSRARTAMRVRHPGHAGTGFLAAVEHRTRAQSLRIVQREILRELRRLGIQSLRP